MASVELDIKEFRSWFRGLTEEAVCDGLLEALWLQACEFCGNTDSTSFAPYDPDATPPVLERKTLLYHALCHLATLHTRGDIAGRIASASEGSVSTSFDLLRAGSSTAQWWNQTQCGATYWVMTAKYRAGGRFYGGGSAHPWG